MESEQVLKQVDWLDEERRKDHSRISMLEERLNAMDEDVSPLAKMIRDTRGEITRLEALISRMDSFDESLIQIRTENKHKFEDLQESIQKREEESEKVRRVEMRSLENSLGELRRELEALPELKRNLKARVDEENRLGRLIDEVRSRIEAVRRSEEEYTRTFRLLDDGRRQDAKRLTDLQGEAAALRKQVDAHRGKIELNNTTLRKVETRTNELAVVETERREALTTFLENQTLREVERERVWKDWQSRFEIIEKQTSDVESNLQTLDATHRSVKRSQQAVDDLAQKVERRINELTEIQRLSEERFRQEWVTFKADDQKRWTNYTLTMEEQRGDSIRQYEQLTEKVTIIEDDFQEMQDLIHQMTEQTEKRLQSLLAMTHEWVSTFERTIGRSV